MGERRMRCGRVSLRVRLPVRMAASAFLASLLVASAAAAQPLPPPPADPDALELSQAPTVEVKQFAFEGNTRLSTEALTQIAEAKLAEFGTRRVTSEQLEDIRKALTLAYTGDEDSPRFVNSGAVLEDQDVSSGVITFTIVEGTLSDIRVMPVRVETGEPRPLRLRPGYISTRLRRAVPPAAPLDIRTLQDELELLRSDPNIGRLNAELRPGDAPGQSILDVMVQEAERYYAALSINNHRSPSVGAEQAVAYLGVRNLTGLGDVLNLRYGITKGGMDELEFSAFDDFSIDYAIPVSPSDTTFAFSLQRTSDSVVEDPFQDLEIDSDSFSIGLTLRQPIYRTQRAEFAVFASIEYRENETELLGDNISFPLGADDGKSAVTPIRIGQEFTFSEQEWAFAARSTVTIGTDWFTGSKGRPRDEFGDPVDFPTADAQFIAWLGQVQYVQRIPKSDVRVVLRGAAQLANDNLLSIEQFSIGGAYTVRGYRENRVVRDNGLVGNAELRIPLLQKSGKSVLEVVPFFDIGYAYNNNDSEIEIEDSDTISSVGIGLTFEPTDWFSGEVFYGYPFNRFDNRDDLQDIGIHFNFVLSKKW